MRAESDERRVMSGELTVDSAALDGGIGGMERWRDGGMERWRDGEMEGWRDGEMERWRDGEMEMDCSDALQL